MDHYMQRHMQAGSDVDELLQAWRREEQTGAAASYESYDLRSFKMSAVLTRHYNKCCRYLGHDNLEMSIQLLPLCSHCSDPFDPDLPVFSDTRREFFLCNVCYLDAVSEEEESEEETPKLVTEEDLPNATIMELSNNLMIRWQEEESRGEKIILEFPQGPMPIWCFKISQGLASLYDQCLVRKVPNLPQCRACNAAKFIKGSPVHSGYNTGLQLCLCNDCYCQMVGENPDEYTTEGQYDDLSVKLRLPSSNLIRIPDDLIAPLTTDPFDYDKPMVELHGILRDFFDRGNTIIIEPKEGIFSICKTLERVFGCNWSGFSYTTGNHYCFVKCAEQYFTKTLVNKYKKTNYSKCHRITCPTTEAAWVNGDEDDDDAGKIVFDQNKTNGTTTGVSVAVHVGENGGKLIWLGNGNEREEYIKDVTDTANKAKLAKQNGSSGETKGNNVTSEEIEQILGLGQVFGWTVGHRKTTILNKHDTGIKNNILNQLVNSSNPPKVTKICHSFGEGFTRKEVNVSIVMISPPIMFVQNEILIMSQIASLFAETDAKQTKQMKKNTKSSHAVSKRRCQICRINTPKTTYSGNQWKKGEGSSKCKHCIERNKN